MSQTPEIEARASEERPAATPEPQQRLAPAAKTAWRISAAGVAVPTAIAVAWAGSALVDAADLWPGLPWVLAAAVVAVLVGLIPQLLWRRWRYEVRPHEIDIRRGAFTVRRTLVPMLRVQHVDTRRDLVQQALGLATVAFHTAAGANAIPHLTRAEAERVRDRIAELTRTPDEL